MTDNTDKLMADALVECGHAIRTQESIAGDKYVTGKTYLVGVRGRSGKLTEIKPFADNLTGRQQADALIGVFRNKHNSQGINLWYLSAVKLSQYPDEEEFEFRGRRLKWCFEQLAEKSHD